MNDFDDSRMTLCDGAISVDGVMVSGSRSFVRDPRLAQPTDAMITALFWRDVTTARITPPEPGKCWCSDCGDWKCAGEFANDPRSATGKSYICRACKRVSDARRYQAKVGRDVREYRERSA